MRPMATGPYQRNTWRRRAKAIAVLALVGAPAGAWAQSPPASPYPPPPLPEPAGVLALRPSPPPLPLGTAPMSDPQADRVVLLPTAFTHPRGTVFLSTYDIAILQAGYAVTDDTQLTLTALPVPSESFTILDQREDVVYRGPCVRVPPRWGRPAARSGGTSAPSFIGRVGGVAQGCLRRACDSSLVVLSSNVALVGPCCRWRTVSARSCGSGEGRRSWASWRR